MVVIAALLLNTIGIKGQETVREKFLITRLLSDYLWMLNAIMVR